MSTVESVFEKYVALLDLEQTTQTRTTRARNDLLRALTDSELTEIALKLKGAGLTNGNRK